MELNEAMGIDVSKKTIDVALYKKGSYKQFENSNTGFKKLIEWCIKETNMCIDNVLICFEHTGLYSLNLSIFLDKKNIQFCMEPAIQIKRSLGLVRGKNDKVDAIRIAEYAWLRREQLNFYKLPSKSIFQLQKLLSLRAKLVVQRADFKGGLNEYKAVLKESRNSSFFNVQVELIAILNIKIKELEKEMLELIRNVKQINEKFSLITSVSGVGLVLGANLLVTTNCFSNFKDARKYACYSGIAPFEKQSGSSLRARPRVSQFANKKIKTLLNMAAMSTILCDPEIKAFYERRVKEGKSKMSSINIIRNKIIHRVFAVVKRGTPYVVLNKYAA